MADKQRLDVALVARGLAPSRERAQALILSGTVFLNNQRADKASLSVAEKDAVEVRGAPHPYVSRGGLKLEKALKAFDIPVQGLVVMDIGASTGGFTDVLLRAGASGVYAIDVGYGQFDWRLRNDPRVTVMERTNARHLTPELFDPRPTLCVMDVSFISVRLILPVVATILGSDGRSVVLVKPQFEAGRDRIGKKGVVRDPAVHLAVLEEIQTFCHRMNWRVQNAAYSPVTGPEGNIEFLFDIISATTPATDIHPPDLKQVVEDAHEKLIQGLQ